MATSLFFTTGPLCGDAAQALLGHTCKFTLFFPYNHELKAANEKKCKYGTYFEYVLKLLFESLTRLERNSEKQHCRISFKNEDVFLKVFFVVVFKFWK